MNASKREGLCSARYQSCNFILYAGMLTSLTTTCILISRVRSDVVLIESCSGTSSHYSPSGVHYSPSGVHYSPSGVHYSPSGVHPVG